MTALAEWIAARRRRESAQWNVDRVQADDLIELLAAARL